MCGAATVVRMKTGEGEVKSRGPHRIRYEVVPANPSPKVASRAETVGSAGSRGVQMSDEQAAAGGARLPRVMTGGKVRRWHGAPPTIFHGKRISRSEHIQGGLAHHDGGPSPSLVRPAPRDSAMPATSFSGSLVEVSRGDNR